MIRVLLKTNLRQAQTYMNMSTSPSFPVTQAITKKLTDHFKPIFLDVVNESKFHNVPKNSETHFKVVVVSALFEETKSLVARHRLVNATLKEELEGPVHALSIIAKSPKQWEAMKSSSDDRKPVIPSSPTCMGGDGSLPSRT